MNNNLAAEMRRSVPGLMHPNNAKPQVIGPLNNLSHVTQGLDKLGFTSAQELPKKFDWRDKYTLLPPTNQMSCGDCWAHSSTNALTDKFIIFKDLKGLELNQLLTTVCTFKNWQGNPSNDECGGGFPYVAGKFFEEDGATNSTSSDCPPSWEDYCAKNNCSNEPVQLPDCSTWSNCILNYKAKKGSTVYLSVQKQDGTIDADATVTNIKQALLNTGPVVGTFQVRADFQMGNVDLTKYGGWNYKWNATNGIYVNGKYNTDLNNAWKSASSQVKGFVTQSLNTDDPTDKWGDIVLGYHAVEVVGWDETGSTPYWIIKNSWGTSWNEAGYWRHAMYPNNMYCGLDVPDTSTASVVGGCTNFEADVGSGGKNGTKVGPASSGGKNNKTMWIIIFSVAIGLVLLLALWFFFLRKKGRRGDGW